MAGTESAVSYVKNEPDDYRRYMTSGAAAMGHQFNHPQQQQQQQQQFGSWNGDMSDLGLTGNTLALAPQTYSSSQYNMPSNFIAGSSGIGDDELEDLLNLPDSTSHAQAQQPRSAVSNQVRMQPQLQPQQQQQIQQQQQQPLAFSSNNNNNNNNNSSSSRNGSIVGSGQNSVAVPVSQRNPYVTQMYSSTPDGGPTNSPFVNSFNYSQWAMQQQQQQQQQQNNNSSSSPRRPSGVSIHSSNGMNMRQQRTSLASLGTNNDSAPRSPLTPKTQSAMGNLQLGTPDSTSFSGGAGMSLPNNHRKSLSTSQWDPLQTGSGSYTDSPITSPVAMAGMRGRLSALHGGKPGSLPNKMESEGRAMPTSTLEAKRQKRRQSHNAVERRRRDNINDRIQELSRLVPQHRLEDDKVRKQLNSQNALSQSLAAAAAAGAGGPSASNSMSPPQATSLLAGGTGRRATTIGAGIALDDKDKGPAKGDVLNGAVGWTRDLMWMLCRKIQQQAQLVEHIESLGGQIPFDIPEDEARMESELVEAFQKNSVANFEYTRTDGSGLYVPNHTDYAGSLLNGAGDGPEGKTGGSGASGMEDLAAGFNSHQSSEAPGMDNESQFWGYNDDDDETTSQRNSLELKEEDEFGMDLE